jgi:hypothetical protein
MNTTGYDKLVGEVTNWEDFVVEGTGALGCCGVDPANYASFSTCAIACRYKADGGKCPDKNETHTVSFTPAGCTHKVGYAFYPVAKRACCVNCCMAYFYKGIYVPKCSGDIQSKGTNIIGYACCTGNCGKGGSIKTGHSRGLACRANVDAVTKGTRFNGARQIHFTIKNEACIP